MESRPLGTPALPVSVIGLGCNNLGRSGTRTETPDGAAAVVHAALDAGITLFDTADIYGKEFGLSERLLGAAIRGRDLDGIVIATKFGHQTLTPADVHGGAPMGSRAYIRSAVEGSLARLGVETIDLYQHHSPDPETPIEETLAALDELVQEGKIRQIGTSNYDAGMLRAADAARAGGARFVSAQNEYNLLTRGAEQDSLRAAAELGLGFLPWFPLANGLFTGKFTRTERPADSRIARQRPQIADNAPWDAMETYAAFCAERSIGMLEATVGWFLSHDALSSVIAGATTPDQVRANAATGSGWRPDAEERAFIDALFPAV